MSEVYPETPLGSPTGTYASGAVPITGMSDNIRQALAASPPAPAAASPELDATEAERDQLLGELTAARAVLAEQRSIRDRLAAERDGLHADRKRLTTALAEMTGERDALATQNGTLIATLEKALAANQRWAETLGDVQQAARERDAARDAGRDMLNHITGRWPAELDKVTRWTEALGDGG